MTETPDTGNESAAQDDQTVSTPEDTTTNPNVTPDGTSPAEGVTEAPNNTTQGSEGDTTTDGDR